MKYVMSWTFRISGTAAENQETMRRGLEVFSKWSPPSSTTFHAFVSRLDGNGGFAVVETDNPMDLADATSKFSFLAEYQIYPVVEMDQAVPALQQGLEFLESVPS